MTRFQIGKTAKTTILAIANLLLLIGTFILYATDLITGEQFSAVILTGASLITSGIGYFSKDDESKSIIDLTDPELVDKLQSQAEIIKHIRNKIREKNKEFVD